MTRCMSELWHEATLRLQQRRVLVTHDRRVETHLYGPFPGVDTQDEPLRTFGQRPPNCRRAPTDETANLDNKVRGATQCALNLSPECHSGARCGIESPSTVRRAFQINIWALRAVIQPLEEHLPRRIHGHRRDAKILAHVADLSRTAISLARREEFIEQSAVCRLLGCTRSSNRMSRNVVGAFDWAFFEENTLLVRRRWQLIQSPFDDGAKSPPRRAAGFSCGCGARVGSA